MSPICEQALSEKFVDKYEVIRKCLKQSNFIVGLGSTGGRSVNAWKVQQQLLK